MPVSPPSVGAAHRRLNQRGAWYRRHVPGPGEHESCCPAACGIRIWPECARVLAAALQPGGLSAPEPGTSARFLVHRLLRTAVRGPLPPFHDEEGWPPEVSLLHPLPRLFPVACDLCLICLAGDSPARWDPSWYLILLNQKRTLCPEGLQ